MARPRGCRSPRTSRAPPMASTARARRRSRRCCTGRRSRAGCRAWCCTLGTSAVRAGRSSPLPATWTQTSGGGWPPANRSSCPNLGLGVLHHVHADDVAQAFERALTRSAAIGSSFHVVSEQAMTMRGLAAGVAGWFGREPLLDLVDWPEFERRVGAEHAGVTRDHAGRSIAASIDRARDILGYTPRYSSLDALHESLRWLAATATSTSVARTSRSRLRDDHPRHPLDRLRHAAARDREPASSVAPSRGSARRHRLHRAGRGDGPQHPLRKRQQRAAIPAAG